MSKIIKKGGISTFFVSLLFLISCTVYVVSLPPPPPDIYLEPPVYCDFTNGGVEICDSIDNDCDGTVDEDACTSSSSDSDSDSSSGSGSSGHKSSGGGSSSGYMAPVVVKNSTAAPAPIMNNSNKSNVSTNISTNAVSSGDLPLNDSANSSMKDPYGKNLIFGLTPLKTLIYGSIIIIALVLLLLLFMEYFIKRPKSSKDALSGTYPASQAPSVSRGQGGPNLSTLGGQDESMARYIAEMRQKGFNDDDIMIKLKNQGRGKQ